MTLINGEYQDFGAQDIKVRGVYSADGTALAVQQAVITALTDNAAGVTADGTIAAITDLSTSNTYTDAAVNAKLVLIRNAIKELSTQSNTILAALKSAGIIASS